jgi:hypothetical protein
MVPLILLFLVSCGQGNPATRVSGKVVYDGMGLEGAYMEFLDLDGEEGQAAILTRSGYHGSFTLELPEGRYTASATYNLRLDDREVKLSGETELVVPGDVKRVDRIVVELR